MKDPGALASALAASRAGTRKGYLHSDLFEMAAAYLFHIVVHHPFLDVNMRTGIVCALVFLALKGQEIEMPDEGLYEMVMATEERSLAKSTIAERLRQRA